MNSLPFGIEVISVQLCKVVSFWNGIHTCRRDMFVGGYKEDDSLDK